MTQGGSNGRAELCAISREEFDQIEKDNPGSIQRVWVKMELNRIETDPRLPKEYEELSSLFEEKSDDDSLPKHQPWDYEIPLELPQGQVIVQFTECQNSN